ncbi:DsbA family protein [Siculibacillus lacustris]|uniref:DsbA family protein n=1 Tax=Siculibacillus lacustris TaxID=1549641 RepID=A0A4Q9VHA7_9HYPH|nr:DsbA family protein [Siculibacillus lacustris]TBW34490.1 DsbA family protein [Siculibacillus lacustris]
MTDDAADDDIDVLAPGTVVVVIDPLCGWCWGAAPALEKLAASHLPLRLVASGLFIGDRPVTPEFAGYAWDNDQRIRALTGQVFSEAYREKVLGATDSKFDSGPATLAFTAVQLREPGRELAVLHALQAARWVDGRDITDEAVVAAVLRETGIDEDTVAAFLSEDEGVIRTLNERATFARDLMHHFSARGVPVLLRVIDGGAVRLDGRMLFEDVDRIVANIEAVKPPAPITPGSASSA